VFWPSAGAFTARLRPDLPRALYDEGVFVHTQDAHNTLRICQIKRRSWPVRDVARRGIRCYHHHRGGFPNLFCVSPPHHLRVGDSIGTSLPARAFVITAVLAAPDQVQKPERSAIWGMRLVVDAC
jgi:hypothetical protein